MRLHDLHTLTEMAESDHRRPRQQWWMELRAIARTLAQPGPRTRQAD